MILALLAALARADETSAWESIYDARLAIVSEGSPEIAVKYCEAALEELAPGDPDRGAVLYTLGRTRWELGEVDAARAALREAATDPKAGAAARALLARIELLDVAVARLPAVCGFEGGLCGFRRSWTTVEKGPLQVRPLEGNAALAWDVQVKAQETDRIALALVDGLPVRSLHLRARAEAFPADLRFTLFDGAGGRYSAPVVEVPTDRWLEIELPLAAFQAQDPTARARTPRRVRLLEIEDLTGLLLPDRGENTIWIDDAAVR